MMTPPATCDSHVSLSTTMPQSWTATTCVQRTTPVSVSTTTSATCTPPTPTLDKPLVSGALASPAVQAPWPLACAMPSLEHASFQGHDLPRFLSVTLPASITRSSTLDSSFAAICLKKSSRAASAALKVAGACEGNVVLPPEPVERPYGLSPSLTRMSLASRPRISAVTTAVTVRWPVPRSCVEVWASTDPSEAMVMVHSLGAPCAEPPQLCSAMPMPYLIGPLVWPGGCHLSFHLLTSAA